MVVPNVPPAAKGFIEIFKPLKAQKFKFGVGSRQRILLAAARENDPNIFPYDGRLWASELFKEIYLIKGGNGGFASQHLDRNAPSSDVGTGGGLNFLSAATVTLS